MYREAKHNHNHYINQSHENEDKISKKGGIKKCKYNYKKIIIICKSYTNNIYYSQRQLLR